MFNYFGKLIFILAIIFALVFGFLNFQKIDLKAQDFSNSNVWGWAWNPGIGWLSFSRDNTGATVDYGVNIDSATGVLSGYAWANPRDDSAGTSNIGWLSFNKSETGLPPAEPFNDDNQDFIAKLDLDSNKLEGWARFLGLKNEGTGWVRFTGPESLYSYSYDSTIFNKPLFNKCSCDTTSDRDCDLYLFPANPLDPSSCYDEERYYETAYALYPSSTANLIAYKFSLSKNSKSGWLKPRADCDTSQTTPSEGTLFGFTSGWNCGDEFYQATSTTPLYDQGYITVLLFSSAVSFVYDKTNQGRFQYNRTSTSTSNTGYLKASCDSNNTTINCSSSFEKENEVYDPNSNLPLNSYYDQYEQLLTKYHIYKKQSNSSYGVTRNNCELQGYAWSQDFGWIKFNGANYGVSTSVCPATPPSASDLTVLQGNYCTFPLQPTFSWTFTDNNPNDEQTAYQIQIAKDPNFLTIVYNYSATSTNSNTHRVSAPPNGLDYETSYYWRVKVWDKTGLGSEWAGPQQFTTAKEAPRIDFSWQYQGKDDSGFNVKFFNQSYMPSGTSTAIWSWTFEDGSPTSSSKFEPFPWVTFNSSGPKEVTLSGTDSNGASCSVSKTVNIEFPAPKWKEILPKILQ